MSGFELIIFDCDGVVVDSERVVAEVFARALREECGLSLAPYAVYEMFVGQPTQRILSMIEQMLGAKPPASLQARYENDIENTLQQSVTEVKGIRRALAEISIPCCIASGGSYEKMRTTLKKTNLLELFESRLYSTSDVSRGKPFPDIYLHAAREMGCLRSDKCLVVEDSPTGVKGGVAAGMTVFGYAELMKEDKLIASGAHHVFKEMSNLANEISYYEQSVL